MRSKLLALRCYFFHRVAHAPFTPNTVLCRCRCGREWFERAD